jgi:hypothetical protein
MSSVRSGSDEKQGVESNRVGVKRPLSELPTIQRRVESKHIAFCAIYAREEVRSP